MSSKLTPYLAFDGRAREAMEFYRDVFGGDLTVNTFGEFGTEGPDGDKVMHSQLETDTGYVLMGSDMPPGVPYQGGGNVTVSLFGDEDALRGYWDKLSDGGDVTVPMEKQMWGDEFGQCVDKYGIAWMINISPPA